MSAVELAPGPGQYIRLREVSESRLGWTHDRTAPGGGFLDSTPMPTTFEVRETRSLYVPADRRDQAEVPLPAG